MHFKLMTIAFIAALAGCSSTGPSTMSPSAASGSTAPAPTPSTAPTAGDGLCNLDAMPSVVGQTFSESLANQTRQRSGARVLRVLQPGQVMTMEYNPQRLTLVVGDGNTISSARCG